MFASTVKRLVLSRNYATDAIFNTCHMYNRSVVRVQGSESAEFLQGLMTNDIEHLDVEEEPTPKAIFAMFLNTQGRVMFDTFIVKTNPEEYLIDCDKYICEKFVKHLKMYKVRRKLNIEQLLDMHVYGSFNTNREEVSPSQCQKDDRIVFQDPRLKSLGARFFRKDMDMDRQTAYLT